MLVACIHHEFGLALAYYALANGTTLITVPKYSPSRCLSVIEKYKVGGRWVNIKTGDPFKATICTNSCILLQVTIAYITPPVAQMLIKEQNLSGHNLSSLRSVLVGGAIVDPEILTMCKERLNLEDLRQGFHALTKTSTIPTNLTF